MHAWSISIILSLKTEIFLKVRIYHDHIMEGPFPQIPTSADIAEGLCDLLIFGFTDKKWDIDSYGDDEVFINDCVPQSLSVRIAEDSLCQNQYNEAFTVESPFHICGISDTSFTDDVSTP